MRRASERRGAGGAGGGGSAGCGARVASAALGLAILALSACSEGEGGYAGTTARVGKDTETIYINNGSEPEYLDPGKSNDSASSTLVQQMFEGLTTYGAGDLRPVQGVATHWEQSDDNRLFRFHLRPEARWSDGKPVTAHDFEYAWKRVLRPSTASLAATNLYVLKNGELFSLGKLKALREAAPLRAAPRPDAPSALDLPKGAFVVVLARSPIQVDTAIAPLAALPEGSAAVTFAKGDGKGGASDRLSFGAAGGGAAGGGAAGGDAAAGGAAPLGSAPGGGWQGAVVEIVRVGPPCKCNGAADRWFEIERGGARGFLPGCALVPPAGNAGNPGKESAGAAPRSEAYAVVTPHTSLPTYDAAAPPSGSAAQGEPPVGFVPDALLVEDDGAVGVRASDDHTLDVQLEQPTPYFTDLTSYVTLFPVRKDVIEAFEKRGEPELWFRPENIVVNGPYTLDEWKFRYEITMKRNPMYWNRDKLKIHRVVWLEVELYNATMNIYKAGDLDYLGDNTSLPAEHMDWLSTKRDFQRYPYLSIYWFEFNTKKPPVDDARVRWALNLAVDKRQIVEKVTRAGQTPATHYVPDYTGSGYDEAVAEDRKLGVDPFSSPEVAFNPERARAMLAEAGYEVVQEGDGYRAKNFPALELLYNTSEGHKQIAVAVQDMWKRHLGVSVTLRNEEWKVMLKNVRDGHYQVVRFGWIGEYNHPATWLGTLLSYSPQNRTGWADQEFDDLMRAAAATADPKESIRAFRKAEKRALDRMPKLPLYFYTKSTLVKPWVKGFKGNSRGVQLVKWLWNDPSWRDNPSNETAFPELEFPAPGRLGAP
ncbi:MULTISPECIES: ABC transporter substrate-binding protein [Sorangium]|uniref:Periplasmic oligopeptide-binding protein n=1 Tax=Sorangium cellulosum (strain So ce56) TaxID=448385 RepID=A9GNN6_SORC5|nr:peptide ABC transporter substrate-binding protein [Sorangium cellulosum]CAN93606.1 periplasmic oligopeptide-binding protein precursor [Sorangium cellulosum So ce56]